MAKARDKNPGEFQQIALLTLAMTGGGLMVLYLVLWFFMVPSVRADVETAAQDYSKLAKLLSSDEMQQMRAEAAAQKESGVEERSLQFIIGEALESNAIESERIGQPKDKQGFQEVVVNLKPGSMRQILRFVVTVDDTKKTIKPHSIDLNRGRAREGEEAKYSAKVTFRDYSPQKK